MDDVVDLPPERDMPPGQLLLRRRLLVREVERMLDPQDVERPERRRRKRRWVALVLVPATLLAAGAGYALTRPPAEATMEGIVCYEEPHQDSGGTVVGADGRSPGEVCEEIWGTKRTGPGTTLGSAFMACVRAEGHYVHVFPSEDSGLCERLGLVDLPPGYERAAARFATMRDELAARLSASACVPVDEATRIVRDVLDAHGFTDWTVPARDFSEARPCAGLHFNSVEKYVLLVPESHPSFGAAISKGLEEMACSGDQVAPRAVRRALDHAGFSDWTVQIGEPTTEEQPCFVAVGTDAERKLVTLHPGTRNAG